MPFLISVSYIHLNVLFVYWRLKEPHCRSAVLVCWLIDGTRAARGHVCHTFKKLKDIAFLALIILSEKISSASPALTPDIPYSNLIFQVINSISQCSTVFFGILSWNRLCPSLDISMSSISISTSFNFTVGLSKFLSLVACPAFY